MLEEKRSVASCGPEVAPQGGEDGNAKTQEKCGMESDTNERTCTRVRARPATLPPT